MAGRTLALALAAVLLSTACGATIAQEDAGGGAVTITNCGQRVTYDRVPERIVTNDTGITEIVFALGLADRVAGYVVGTGHASDLESSPWKAEFAARPKIATKISAEVVQGANADLVFAGWNYGFSESTGFTPDALADLGVPTYLLTESCRNGTGTQRGIMPPLEALYTDLRNLGQIFGVPERAEALVARYQREVAEAEELMEGRPAPDVFLYDSGIDQPFTSGANAAPQEIVSRAGGRNVFDDLDDSWTTAGWESVVDRDPDVVLINDYDDGDAATADAKREFLLSHPAIADVTAIRERRFFVLPYAALVESPRNPAAIRAFAEFLAAIP
ncbi:ABC transporter substrate-binding protein [Umezawaea beigongshangensis]|uniref:ABC transporter substrate-binding protein n=1 Tax=Umezawaea beigongshangensis TaxID=2780383 RepID=UPI0018F21AE9|nr:ABC transporter substrate-binding protein [Umezawaea beigongshangensis]